MPPSTPKLDQVPPSTPRRGPVSPPPPAHPDWTSPPKHTWTGPVPPQHTRPGAVSPPAHPDWTSFPPARASRPHSTARTRPRAPCPAQPGPKQVAPPPWAGRGGASARANHACARPASVNGPRRAGGNNVSASLGAATTGRRRRAGLASPGGPWAAPQRGLGPRQSPPARGGARLGPPVWQGGGRAHALQPPPDRRALGDTAPLRSPPRPLARPPHEVCRAGHAPGGGRPLALALALAPAAPRSRGSRRPEERSGACPAVGPGLIPARPRRPPARSLATDFARRGAEEEEEDGARCRARMKPGLLRSSGSP